MKKITVLSELKAEFAGLIEKVSVRFSRFLKSSPRSIFAVMVAILLVSLLLCFTLFRRDEKVGVTERKALVQVGDGLTEIGSTASALRKTLEMRATLKGLLSKDTLSRQDSLLMVSLIAELDKSQVRINNK